MHEINQFPTKPQPHVCCRYQPAGVVQPGGSPGRHRRAVHDPYTEGTLHIPTGVWTGKHVAVWIADAVRINLALCRVGKCFFSFLENSQFPWWHSFFQNDTHFSWWHFPFSLIIWFSWQQFNFPIFFADIAKQKWGYYLFFCGQIQFNRWHFFGLLVLMFLYFTTCIWYKKVKTKPCVLQACGKFVVTPELMTKAKKKMVVMHPLPRNFEIRYKICILTGSFIISFKYMKTVSLICWLFGTKVFHSMCMNLQGKFDWHIPGYMLNLCLI